MSAAIINRSIAGCMISAVLSCIPRELAYNSRLSLRLFNKFFPMFFSNCFSSVSRRNIRINSSDVSRSSSRSSSRRSSSSSISRSSRRNSSSSSSSSSNNNNNNSSTIYDKRIVAVAMSGGIDSAYTAYLLKKEVKTHTLLG